MAQVKYSVIVACYCETNEHVSLLQRLINSIVKQQRKDVEILLVHDGPWLMPFDDTNCILLNTEKRFNAWGHPSRDLGITKAKGDYILITNQDNVYKDDIFSHLDKYIKYDFDMYCFQVVMRGLENINGTLKYSNPRDYSKGFLLTGRPRIMRGTVDVMSMVIRKDVWFQFGGWKDYSEESDHILYTQMEQQYFCLWVPLIIGEHY